MGKWGVPQITLSYEEKYMALQQYFEKGLSAKELATITGVHIATVRKWLQIIERDFANIERLKKPVKRKNPEDKAELSKDINDKINTLNNNCINITTETEFKELFKGVIIMFIKDIIILYNKLLIKLPNLKYSSSSEKITNLNILLTSLEGDGKLYGIDCCDIILRAYITYFYVKFRDDMMSWNIENVKKIF